jgi:hypothetical protein
MKSVLVGVREFVPFIISHKEDQLNRVSLPAFDKPPVFLDFLYISIIISNNVSLIDLHNDISHRVQIYLQVIGLLSTEVLCIQLNYFLYC